MSHQALPVSPRFEISISARERLRALLRGRPADSPWSRPALLGVALLAAALMLWGLTANGYANTYYASAVYAGSHSWSAFFYDALDLSRYVALDKTPLSIWMMSLSARIFGFGSFTMLLPDALCGVASVLVLHDAVRRTLGHRAAIVAALMLALTPVTVVMSRFNNPDALLVLLLVCAAWATVRAIETGRTRQAAAGRDARGARLQHQDAPGLPRAPRARDRPPLRRPRPRPRPAPSRAGRSAPAPSRLR